jgi:hypothetical protein
VITAVNESVLSEGADFHGGPSGAEWEAGLGSAENSILGVLAAGGAIGKLWLIIHIGEFCFALVLFQIFVSFAIQLNFSRAGLNTLHEIQV